MLDVHHYIYTKCTFRLYLWETTKTTIAAIIHHGPGLEHTRNAARINLSKQCRYKQTNKQRKTCIESFSTKTCKTTKRYHRMNDSIKNKIMLTIDHYSWDKSIIFILIEHMLTM